MRAQWRSSAPWLLGGAALLLAGWLLIVRIDIAQRRDIFQDQGRIAHRLFSQQASQLDAVLATLVLLSPDAGGAAGPEQRLPALYPQVLAVLRHDAAQPWPDPALNEAEERSRATRHAALGPVDAPAARYVLVQAGEPLSFALHIDLQRMVPWAEWPLAQAGPVRVELVHAGLIVVLQAGQQPDLAPAGLTEGFVFAQRLASASQPFELRLRRATGPVQWPWALLGGWTLAVTLSAAVLAGWHRTRRLRHRAEGLLRVNRVAWLNAQGELAAGIAHELNQPLTAVLSNTQAAVRLLADEPPALATVQHAMLQAAAQARRAGKVLARLRSLIEASPTAATAAPHRQPVQMESVLRQVLELLEPELRRHGIDSVLQGQAPAVQADAVALEQILHNLIGNAVQALQAVPIGQRQLRLQFGSDQHCGVLTVRDSGPGIAPAALARVFEPFYTTRADGLGLGLSLCESLAQGMHGTLTAHNAAPCGAEFRLALPLAEKTP